MLPSRLAAGASLALLLLALSATEGATASPTSSERPDLAAEETVPVTPPGSHIVEPPIPTRAPDPFPLEGARTASPQPVAQRVAPLDETFQLHSDPGSELTIFLDFDGADVRGTYWNDPNGVGPGALADDFYAGYSEQPDPALSDGELERIQQVWKIVAEKFATFDVNVTTQDQGPSVYTRDTATDRAYGVHVVFSADPRVGTICGGGCGGVALVGTFDTFDTVAGYSTIAWVREGSSNPAHTALAAAHEIGHTLGLFHDGKGADEYYDGQGPWTPTMGSGPNPIQQFSNGDYTGATNQQDDFAHFLANGLPRRYDEAGGTVAAATSLGARASYDQSGLVTDRNDVDVYRVSHPCETDLTVRATTVGLGSPLDIKLAVLDGSGGLRGSDDPPAGVTIQGGNLPRLPAGTDASVTVASAARGTYFVRVDGVGSGTASDGYSDYGSVGTYRLEVSGCAGATTPAPGVPRDLQATASRGAATVSWSAPSPATGVTGYRLTGLPGGPYEVGATTTSLTVRDVPGGRRLRVAVVALGAAGGGDAARTTLDVRTYAPASPPSVRATVTGTNRVDLTWAPAPNPGGAAGVEWRISGGNTRYKFSGTMPYEIRGSFPYFAPPGSYRVTVTPVMLADEGVAPARTVDVVVGAPSAPRIAPPSSGASGKPVTATARWSPPVTAGAGPVTGYQVVASKIDSRGRTLRTLTSKMLAASARSYKFPLPAGRYRFQVVARNRYVASPASGRSTAVVAR